MITGMRGLCNGLGPAVFGVIFYLFHVDLNEDEAKLSKVDQMTGGDSHGGGVGHVTFDTGTSNITAELVEPHHALSHVSITNGI
jgi:hypothetical protein